jgi:catechol 2,3-dioxygenase-like lactoylglutathione lyase family enzyme
MDNPSIMSHVSVGTNDFARAVVFYDAVLATVGARRLVDHTPDAVAYGKQYPEFWVNRPLDEKAATIGNGSHFSFFAKSREEVEAFHAVALANGGQDEGAPGPRPEYGAPFFGCYVRDLDGNKIEATFWDTSLEQA